MIKPDKSKLHDFLLSSFLDWKFGQRFGKVNFHLSDTINPEKSLLIIGNHVTWWDGFVVWQFNRQLLKKNFYVMMLEDQLRKLWFFRKIGGFSINPGNRSVTESLRFAAEVLKNRENLLLFYPQGRLHSLYDQDFTFHKGVDYLLKENQNIDLLFYSLFIDYASNEQPYINVFLKVATIANHSTHAALEQHYKLFYDASKQQHILDFKP